MTAWLVIAIVTVSVQTPLPPFPLYPIFSPFLLDLCSPFILEPFPSQVTPFITVQLEERWWTTPLSTPPPALSPLTRRPDPTCVCVCLFVCGVSLCDDLYWEL